MSIIKILVSDLILLMLSILFLKLSKIKILSFNPITLFFDLYFVYIIIAQIFIILSKIHLENQLLDMLVSIDNNSVKINILVFGFIFLFSLGIFFAQITYSVLKLKRKSAKKVLKSKHDNYNLYVIYFLVLLIINYFLLLIFWEKFGIFILSSDPDFARYSALENGAWKYLLIMYVYINLPLGSLSFFYNLKLRGYQRFTFQILFLLSFLFQLTSILSAFRSFIFLYILLLSSIYFSVKKVSRKEFITISLLGFTSIVFITFLKYRDIFFQDYSIFLYKLLHRTIFDSSYSLKIIFYIFDTINYPKLYGISYVWDILSKLPGQQSTFQNFLAEKWGETDWHMVLAPTLPGELYANFGWFSLIFALLYGYILALLFFFLQKKLKVTNKFKYTLIYILLTVLSIRSVTVGFGGVYFALIAISILFLPVQLSIFFVRHSHNLRYKKDINLKSLAVLLIIFLLPVLAHANNINCRKLEKDGKILIINNKNNVKIKFENGTYMCNMIYIQNEKKIIIQGTRKTYLLFRNLKKWQAGIFIENSNKIILVNLNILQFPKKLEKFGEHGILINKSTNIFINNLKVSNFMGHGICIRNSSNVLLKNITVHDNRKFGIVIEGKSKNIKMTNIRAMANGWYQFKNRYSNISIGDKVSRVSITNIDSSYSARDGLAIGNNPENREEGAFDIFLKKVRSYNNYDHGVEIFAAKKVRAKDIECFLNYKNGFAIYDDPDGSYAKNIGVKNLITYDNNFYGIHIQGAQFVNILNSIILNNRLGNLHICNGIFYQNKTKKIRINNLIINIIKKCKVLN